MSLNQPMTPRNRKWTPPPRVPGRLAPRPKLAATIVLVREKDGHPQILMGKRSAKHDFMPSVYVFPGGRVDPADSHAPSKDHLNSRTREILESGMSPARARACVLAAIRETFEETSLIIGQAHKDPVKNMKDPSWQAYLDTGYLPSLRDIDVIGRAITPTHRNKRFDTWFFMAKLSEEAAQRTFKNSAELVDTHWFTFDEIAGLDLHAVTRELIGVTKEYLSREHHPRQVFFSRQVGNKLMVSGFPE